LPSRRARAGLGIVSTTGDRDEAFWYESNVWAMTGLWPASDSYNLAKSSENSASWAVFVDRLLLGLTQWLGWTAEVLGKDGDTELRWSFGLLAGTNRPAGPLRVHQTGSVSWTSIASYVPFPLAIYVTALFSVCIFAIRAWWSDYGSVTSDTALIASLACNSPPLPLCVFYRRCRSLGEWYCFVHWRKSWKLLLPTDEVQFDCSILVGKSMARGSGVGEIFPLPKETIAEWPRLPS